MQSMLKLSKIGSLFVALSLLSYSHANAATPSYRQFYQSQDQQCTAQTTWAVPAECGTAQFMNGPIEGWDDGAINVEIRAIAWIDNNTAKLLTRHFLVKIVDGVMVLAASESSPLFGVSTGWLLTTASLGVAIDNVNHTIGAQFHGVSGQTINWGATITGSVLKIDP
jgi:hypothetical protein